MSDFNPGDGWREVGVDEANAQESIRHATRDSMRYWVREAPVPPLPTEPYTVIRVTWREDSDYARRRVNPVLIRQPETAYHQWAWSDDGDSFGDDSDVRSKVTGFEVLAEPRPLPLDTDDDFEERVRRETAKAVLEAVRKIGLIQIALLANPRNAAAFDAIARDFGVEQ